MNLDKFKPAWNQFKVMSRFDYLSDEEIMCLVKMELNETKLFLWQKVMRQTALYSLLIIFCQG